MTAWGIHSYKAGYEESVGRGANVLQYGGTVMLGDGSALRDSRDADLMCMGGRFLPCGGMCLCDGVAPECAR